jgi:hypothetical protein
MTDLERLRRTRHPAQVVGRARPARQVEILTAPYHRKTDLVAAVNRHARRGEVRPLNPHPIYSVERGVWEQRVIRLKPRPPAWRKPLLIGVAILAGVGAFGALAWWVLTSLAALPLGLLCLFAVVALGWILRAGNGTSVRVETHTSVYVKTR